MRLEAVQIFSVFSREVTGNFFDRIRDAQVGIIAPPYSEVCKAGQMFRFCGDGQNSSCSEGVV